MAKKAKRKRIVNPLQRGTKLANARGMPAGRPSSYDPAYCERLIQLGNEGASVITMCHEIGVGRTTLEDLWPETYPDFKLALEMARIASQNWWETTGRDGMLKKNIDSSIWSRSMAARFPKDWRESKLLGSDPENPLPSSTIDVSQLSDAAKRELAKLKI